MQGATHQALRCAANLSLPRVQVIVMSANMGCNHCRQRVHRIISKINGLLDYEVDVRSKEVIVRGAIDPKTGTLEVRKCKFGGALFSNPTKERKKFTCFSALFP